MAKYVKCVANNTAELNLTKDKTYKLLDSSSDDFCKWAVKNDLGDIVWYSRGGFVEDVEGVYRSQEEFEDAVMKVVLERLRVYKYGNIELDPFTMKDIKQ